MADGVIAVLSLVVAPGQRQNVLTWTSSIGSCLPYLALERYEIWASASNNRSNAVKVAEVADYQYVHGNLGDAATRFYWVRARDLSKNVGDFFPLSQTGGIVGTTLNATVTPGELATSVKDINTAIAGVTADLGDRFAASQIKFSTAETVAAGYAATLEIIVRALGQSGALRELGMLFDLPIGNGKGRVRLRAGGGFVIENAAGQIVAVFDANGKLNVNVLKAKSIDAGDVLINGSTITEVIANEAVFKMISSTPSTFGLLNSSWQTLKASTINVQNSDGQRRVRVEAVATFERVEGDSGRDVRLRLTKNDDPKRSAMFTKFGGVGPMTWPISFVDNAPSNGNDEWRFEATATNVTARDCDLILLGYKR